MLLQDEWLWEKKGLKDVVRGQAKVVVICLEIREREGQVDCNMV